MHYVYITALTLLSQVLVLYFFLYRQKKVKQKELVAVVGSLKIIYVSLNDLELATLGQQIVLYAPLR